VNLISKILNLSLSWKVTFFFITGALLPFIIIFIFSLKSYEENLTIEIEKRSLFVLNQKSQKIDQYITKKIQEINFLTTNPVLINSYLNLSEEYSKNKGNILPYLNYVKTYDHFFSNYIDSFGFYDLFLVQKNGDIIYTVKREEDFNTNLLTGKFKNTQLADLFQDTIYYYNSKISNFQYYEPSKYQAAFIGAPVFIDNQITASLLLQISIDDIFSVFLDKSGLRYSDTISVSRFLNGQLYYSNLQKSSPDSEIFIPATDLEQNDFIKILEKSASGETGFGKNIIINGKNVLVSWTYLPYLDWGLVISENADDAYASLHNVRLAGSLLFLLVFFATGFSIIYFNRFILNPLKQLTEKFHLLSSGVDVLDQNIERKDEIGVLSMSFNTMRKKIGEMVQGLNETNKLLLEQKKQLFESSIELEKRVEERTKDLLQSNEKIQAIMENTTALIYIKNCKGKYVLVNKMFLITYNLSEEKVYDKNDYELFSEEIAMKIINNDNLVFKSGKSHEFEEEIYQQNTKHIFLSVKVPLHDTDGKLYGLCSISTNITDRKRSEERLKLFESVFNHAKEAIVITDNENTIVDINPFYSQVMGYKREEIVGKTPALVKSGKHDDLFYQKLWNEINTTGHWSGEIWDRRKSGEIFPKWLNISSIRNEKNEILYYIGIFSDISDKKAIEQSLHKMAYFDPLTNLANRVLFRERVDQQIISSHHNHKKFAVFILDLDRFKYVNDTFGHIVGDQLLMKASERILQCVDDVDTVARLGGDEFSLILVDIENDSIIRRKAKEIINSLETNFNIYDNDIFISTSIGISIYPDDGENYETLMKNADIAMYQVKSEGRGAYHFFKNTMNEKNARFALIQNELRKGLLNNEFAVHYQPKIDIIKNKIVGFEALIRWFSPVLGNISPAEFIPIAEENGLIINIGQWILNRVCADYHEVSNGNDDIHVAINLSARQLSDHTLLDKIDTIIKKNNIKFHCLEFEITETSIITDQNVSIPMVNDIKKMGFKISMDDFGTGYSSLSYLKKLPIDTIKIDQSFIRDLEVDSEDFTIVLAIISIAKKLNMELVAEGVETKEQVKILKENGCNILQGYYYSKPIPLSMVSDLYKKFS